MALPQDNNPGAPSPGLEAIERGRVGANEVLIDRSGASIGLGTHSEIDPRSVVPDHERRSEREIR